MCDEIDQAQELEALNLEIALRNTAARQKMKEIGKCYYCSESISAGCFCDSFCRTDWENRRRADLMRGKAA
jgi:hypothetical protein